MDLLQRPHGLGAACQNAGAAQGCYNLGVQTGLLGEVEYPEQRLAGHEDDPIEMTRDQITHPIHDGGRVGGIDDTDHGTAQSAGALFLQHLSQFFAPPAFRQSNGFARKRCCHACRVAVYQMGVKR